MATPRTLYDKIWDKHLVDRQEDGTCLHLYRPPPRPRGDEPAGLRRLAHGGPQGAPAGSDLAVADHNVPTDRPLARASPSRESRIQIETLEKNCAEFGVPYFPMDDIRQGIVHIIGPEQGLTLPGHDHRLRRQPHLDPWRLRRARLRHRHLRGRACAGDADADAAPAKNMRITVDGKLPPGVTAKDIILAIIGKIGTAGGTGHVIEYAGDAIRALSMEGRMTVCNMSIEAGARAGLIAPDETTFDYVEGPADGAQGRRLGTGRRLLEDAALRSRRHVRLARSCSTPPTIAPQVTWGTSPEDVLPITGGVPEPGRRCRRRQAPRAMERALDYMGLKPGHADERDQGRPRLHRLLHQQPHRGPARGRQGRARAARSPSARPRDGGAGLRPGEGAGRGGRARHDLHRGRLRMARARLLDVPGDERRTSSSPASAAPRPPTATSKAARAAAGAPT